MSSVFARVQRRQLSPASAITDSHVAKKDESVLRRLELSHTLDFHRGCVNTVKWDASGTRILSGSDDRKLILADAFGRGNRPELVVETAHKGNIFSAVFLDERNVVSAAGDGRIVYTNLDRPEATRGCVFTCHTWATYEVISVPNEPQCFLSAGEDGAVRLFDLRIKEKCLKPNCAEDAVIGSRYPVTALALNSLRPNHLAAGMSDSCIRLYDRRMLSTDSACSKALMSRFSVAGIGQKQRKVTSVAFRPDGLELLASFSSDFVYIFDPLADDASKGRRLYVGKRSHTLTSSSSSPLSSSVPKRFRRSPPPMRRLRLRGDWSDTGPNARPDAVQGADDQPSLNVEVPTPRNSNLMQRMTDALSRMLNDPSTRRALLNNQEERGQRLPPQVENNEESNSQNGPSSSTTQTVEETAHPNDNSDDVRNSNELDSTFSPALSRSNVISSSHPISSNVSRGDESPEFGEVLQEETLPGPSQVVTHPGNPGVDPLTGRRQRRRGVSGPPSPLSQCGHCPLDCVALGRDSDEGEFEIDDSDQSTDTEGARRVLQPPIIQRFVGHRNARTMIKEASWWGNDFILSGSDCGHVIGWSRKSGRVVLLLEADRHVVNSVQPHPVHPVLATSGIDYNVKLWAPTKPDDSIDQDAIDDLVRRNEVMLRETMDTVTVPPTLMIRMLASLNQLRRTNSQRLRANEEEGEGGRSEN